MLRILANDGLEASAIQTLREAGHEVVTDFHDVEALKTALKDFDVIVIRSATKIRKELIDAVKGSRLKLMIRAGVGIDNIDVEYAEANGFTVRNTPNASSASVAELALGHMFALARHIHVANVTMKKGEWNKKHYQGVELNGKTLGLVGFGRISRSLAEKANALGMKVVYTDLFKIEGYDQYEYLQLNELLPRADFISCHVPLAPGAKPVLGASEIAQMKDGVFLVNTARGGVIDEMALVEALDTNKVAAAALDVFVEEPTKNEAVISHPRISLTPHVGASTDEAQERIGVEVVQTILGFFK
jgi:D-3-phosphoglycerate dehydrogenase